MKCSFLKSNKNLFCQNKICLVFVKTLIKRKHATFWSGLAIQVSSNRSEHNVPVNSKTPHAPPLPTQTPGHLTFLKNFGQDPRYVASLNGQMPHPFELQRGSNR